MKTVLITGSSRGIGAATAKLFAENGFNVVINYNKSAKQAENLLAEIISKGGTAVAIKANVSSPTEVSAMIDEVNSRFGGVDVLVNNAGISSQRLFTDISEEEWAEFMNVNLGGVFRTTKAVLPKMINKKSGKIINISSIWGITGASCEVHYSTAKAAIIGFTKALAKEVGPSGITVNCIAPGVVDTEMNAAHSPEIMAELAEETPLGVIGKPLDIANAIFFLASEKADFITGQVISPNGGFLI